MGTEFNDKYKGYRVTSFTSCKEVEGGYWFAEQKITQERKEDGKDWEKREANSSARAKSAEEALSQVYLSMATYLDTVRGDLFQELDIEEEKKELLN